MHDSGLPASIQPLFRICSKDKDLTRAYPEPDLCLPGIRAVFGIHDRADRLTLEIGMRGDDCHVTPHDLYPFQAAGKRSFLIQEEPLRADADPDIRIAGILCLSSGSGLDTAPKRAGLFFLFPGGLPIMKPEKRTGKMNRKSKEVTG